MDSSQVKQKAGFYGKTVISPERLPELRCSKVFCFTRSAVFVIIKNLLQGTGIKAVGPYDILFED